MSIFKAQRQKDLGIDFEVHMKSFAKEDNAQKQGYLAYGIKAHVRRHAKQHEALI
jgi:hypothetical protein